MSTNKAPQQKKAPVIQINQEVLHNNLSDYVRKNLEDVLNELLDAEADRLCHAKRYERNAERASTRAGSYKRNFETTSGKVTLNIPKLRNLPFETAIIERYRRRESSIEEAMMEMYLAGVSVRRVEDITEALWGAKVSAGTISNLNKKIYGSIEEWRNRPLEAEYPYIYMDGIWLSAPGEEQLRMYPFLWMSESIKKVIVKCSELLKEAVKTRKAGSTSAAILRNGDSGAQSLSYLTKVWVF